MTKKHIEDEELENENEFDEEIEIEFDEYDYDEDSIEIEDEVIDEKELAKSRLGKKQKKKDDSDEDIALSKHKEEGKHSLKYDSIFKGKKEEPLTEEDDIEGYITGNHKDTIEVDKSSQYYFESIDNEKYIRDKQVKDKVYQVLTEHTEINFLNNRRKPSKVDFNTYYALLKTHLKGESFTNIELFNELAVYFSDNLFNMFKLLENEWRNMILNELQEHIGKSKKSKEISNRNIHEGTEIEFLFYEDGEDKLITGVVLETDYVESKFKVDSYENIYTVDIDDITKILNNTKFKYNLNKLNNIDFL